MHSLSSKYHPMHVETKVLIISFTAETEHHVEWLLQVCLCCDFAGVGAGARAKSCGAQTVNINGTSWPCTPEMSSGAAGHGAALSSEPFNQLLSLHFSRRESQCCAWALLESPMTCLMTAHSVSFIRKYLTQKYKMI